MGYVDGNLISDEVITYRGRLHWIGLVAPGIVAAVFVAIGLFVAARGFDEGGSPALGVSGLVLILVGAAPLIKAVIDRNSAEFAVTNKRVIFKVGFVQRRTTEMFLSKIESVGVDQTIFGRLVGYGSIVLHGTGGSTEPFHKIAQPLQFRKQIQEQIARVLDQPGRGSTAPTGRIV